MMKIKYILRILSLKKSKVTPEKPSTSLHKAKWPWKEGNVLYSVGSKGCDLYNKTMTNYAPNYSQNFIFEYQQK